MTAHIIIFAVGAVCGATLWTILLGILAHARHTLDKTQQETE